MKSITVLYDRTCDFCGRCKGWLKDQPKFVELVFLPAGTSAVRDRFPDLAGAEKVDELVAIDDEGGVYRGAAAWILCLWALKEYREWSEILASPAMMPLARGAFEVLSANRGRISRLLGPTEEESIAEMRALAGEEFDRGAAPAPDDGVVIVEEGITEATAPPPPVKNPR